MWVCTQSRYWYFRFGSTKLKQDLKLDWQPVIGLEVHAQIKADGKLFSGASSKYGGPVNTQVAFLDSALPGTLPVSLSCLLAFIDLFSVYTCIATCHSFISEWQQNQEISDSLRPWLLFSANRTKKVMTCTWNLGEGSEIW